MAYLHCHACTWSQDDFWNENYNPIKYFQNDLDNLLNGDLDQVVQIDSSWLEANGYTKEDYTVRMSILCHLDQIHKQIESMKYRTVEEYKEKNPEGICPGCGNNHCLDID